MNVVLDASSVVSLTLRERGRPFVVAAVDAWRSARVVLNAPDLLRSEWASSVVKAIGAGTIGMDAVIEAWEAVLELGIVFHAVDPVAAVEIASRLGRRSAYDAAYLALAEQLGAELWTLDGPLYRNATASGLPVRLFG